MKGGESIGPQDEASKEELRAEIQELREELEKVKKTRSQDRDAQRSKNKEIQRKAGRTEHSRRKFLKALGGGAAFAAAAALIPSTAGFEITSSNSLKYFNKSSSTSSFAVNPAGDLSVNRIGSDSNRVIDVFSESLKADELNNVKYPDPEEGGQGIEDAIKSADGATVVLQPGATYTVEEPILLEPDSHPSEEESARGTTIIGNGRKIGTTNTTVKAASDLNDDIFKFNGDRSEGERVSGFGMYRVSLIGNSENQTRGCCIRAPFFSSVFFRCSIEDAHNVGLWLEATGNKKTTDNNRVQYSTLKKSNTNLVNGFYLDKNDSLKYKSSGSQYFGPYNSFAGPSSRSSPRSWYFSETAGGEGPANIISRGDNVNIFWNHSYDLKGDANTHAYLQQGDKQKIVNNHFDGKKDNGTAILLRTGGRDMMFPHIIGNTFLDDFGTVIDHDPKSYDFRYGMIEQNDFAPGLSGSGDFDIAVNLQSGNSKPYEGYTIKDNKLNGSYSTADISGLNEGAIIRNNPGGSSSQDVRQISAPVNGTVAQHDGSGDAGKGISYYDGGNWNVLDGGTQP